MVAVAPGYIVFVLDFDHAGIIAVFTVQNFRIIALEFDWLILKFPFQAIFGAANKNIHRAAFIIAAEYTDKTVFPRNNRAVEDRIGIFLFIPLDNRVFVITPQNILAICRFVLPRDIRKRISDNFCHNFSPFSDCSVVIFRPEAPVGEASGFKTEKHVLSSGQNVWNTYIIKDATNFCKRNCVFSVSFSRKFFWFPTGTQTDSN